jgi:PAP2 superfamily C-terminal
MLDRWNRSAALQVAASVAFATAVLLAFARFVVRVERRPGAVLTDPLLAHFEAVDVSWLTFGLIYASFIAAFLLLVPRPDRMAHGFAAYGLMFVLRGIAMYLTPLDPPVGMLPLRDPFVQLFNPGGAALTRDLFFSGHTASMFLLVLLAPGPRSRAFFAATTATVATCVLLQKVHYGVDVFVAPAYSYLAYRLVGLLRRRLGLAPEVFPDAPAHRPRPAATPAPALGEGPRPGATAH